MPINLTRKLLIFETVANYRTSEINTSLFGDKITLLADERETCELSMDPCKHNR